MIELGVPPVQEVFTTLLKCFEDYTVDERGDVGSWIRIAAIRALTEITVALFSTAKSGTTADDFQIETFLPPSTFVDIISGTLKQGVERLDTVRQEAGTHIAALLKSFAELEVSNKDLAPRYRLPGHEQITTALKE